MKLKNRFNVIAGIYFQHPLVGAIFRLLVCNNLGNTNDCNFF